MFFTDQAFDGPAAGHMIFARDEGHDIPVLNLVTGEGAPLPEDALDAVVKNIASVLNGNDPVKDIDLSAEQSGWEPQSTGMRLFVRRRAAKGDRSSLYAVFNPACPPELVRQVFNCLAEGGMGKVMARIH